MTRELLLFGHYIRYLIRHFIEFGIKGTYPESGILFSKRE
jgi:hypothetical protein